MHWTEPQQLLMEVKSFQRWTLALLLTLPSSVFSEDLLEQCLNATEDNIKSFRKPIEAKTTSHQKGLCKL